MRLSGVCCLFTGSVCNIKTVLSLHRTHIQRTLLTQSSCTQRAIHTSSVRQFLDARDKDHEKKQKQLVVHQSEFFDEMAKKEKSKKAFESVIQFYLRNNATYRRGHVEFIYAALSRMKDFETHRDLDTYKKLVDLFPKEKMVPQNVWQVEMMHYPKQQQCCIDLLDQMESNGVIPDDDMGYLMRSIFGDKSHAFRKYRRMMYWMPKFRFANPYYVPYDLPKDRIELAKLALDRMAVDLENQISVFMSEELESAADRTYIVSSQSPAQSQLIQDHPTNQPVFVEGGFNVWLRSESLTYFVLRSDCTSTYKRFHESRKTPSEEPPPLKWSLFDDSTPRSVSVAPGVHEQEDGTVLATCITGSSSKDSVASWVRFLERANPCLSAVPVLFLLRSPHSELDVVKETDTHSF